MEEHQVGCKFCLIKNDDQYGELIFVDEKNIVFESIMPKAETHLLICPKNHIDDVNHLRSAEEVHSLEVTAKEYLNSRPDFENVAKCDDYLIGFHRPPHNSVGHLHLHVVYPVSNMSVEQMADVVNEGWVTATQVKDELDKSGS